MDNSLRITGPLIVLTVLMLSARCVQAGPFLDLDIGTHLTDWKNNCTACEPRYLGEESPIAIVRFGYQTKTYNLFGPVDARVHAYYEHMSSAGNANDHGIDVLMFGVRFE